MPNPLTQDPGQSFIDSPWLQLGVPLAATIAAAIAPRHMGNASRAAIGGLDAINSNRQGQMRMKHYFDKDKEERDQAAETDKYIDSQGQNTAPPQAPEGGAAPEAERASATQSLDGGTVPSVTASGSNWSEQDKRDAHFLARTDKAAFAKFVMEKRKPPEQKRVDYHYSEYENPDHQKVLSRVGSDDSQTQFVLGDVPQKPEGGPKTFQEGFMSPDAAIQARARAGFDEEKKIALANRPPAAPEDPEKRVLREAIEYDNQRNPQRSPAQRAQVAGLLKSNVDVADLDRIVTMVLKRDPRGMASMQQAVGRGGAPVRSYIMGRTLEQDPNFDFAGMDRTINLMNEASDPAKPIGRSILAYHTLNRHAGAAYDIVDEVARSGMPILNRPLNKFLKDYAGDPRIVDLKAAISAIPYEYMTLLNNGHALTDQDRKTAEGLIDLSMSGDQLKAVLARFVHTAQARKQEMNTQFKQTTGIDLPDSEAASADEQKVMGGYQPKTPKPKEADSQGRPPIESFFR